MRDLGNAQPNFRINADIYVIRKDSVWWRKPSHLFLAQPLRVPGDNVGVVCNFLGVFEFADHVRKMGRIKLLLRAFQRCTPVPVYRNRSGARTVDDVYSTNQSALTSAQTLPARTGECLRSL